MTENKMKHTNKFSEIRHKKFTYMEEVNSWFKKLEANKVRIKVLGINYSEGYASFQFSVFYWILSNKDKETKC